MKLTRARHCPPSRNSGREIARNRWRNSPLHQRPTERPAGKRFPLPPQQVLTMKTISELAADLDAAIRARSEPASIDCAILNERGELVFIDGQQPAAPAAQPPAASPYFTVTEAGAYLHTTAHGIYSRVKRGRLRPLPGSPGRLLF